MCMCVFRACLMYALYFLRISINGIRGHCTQSANNTQRFKGLRSSNNFKKGATNNEP